MPPRLFFKNAWLVLLGQILEKLKVFIFLPLLTRYLGEANYGAWTQMGIVTATFAPLIFMGTDGAVVRYLAGQAEDKQRSWFSAWCLFLIGTASVVCCLLILYRHEMAKLFWGTSDSYALFLPLAALAMVANAGRNTAVQGFRLHNQAKIFPLIILFEVILNSGALALALFQQVGLYRLIVYTVISDCVVAVLGMLLISFEFGWAKPDFSIIPKLLKFGIIVLPSAYAMWGLNSMDRIFLVKYSDLAHIGIYATSYSLGYMVIPFMVRPFSAMFAATATTFYAQGKKSDLQREFRHSAGMAFALSLPATAGLYFLGGRILQLMAGDAFTAGSHLLPLISLAYICSVFHSYFAVSLALAHRHIYTTMSALIAVGVNFFLNWWLIPKYSITGAAVATLLAFAVEFLIVYIVERRYVKLFVSDFRYVAKIILCTAVMSVAVLFARRILSMIDAGNVLFLTTLAVIGVIVYLTALFATRVLTLRTLKASIPTLWGR